MAGMWDFCDARITTDDDPELIDIEQGIPHMKVFPVPLRNWMQTKLNDWKGSIRRLTN